MAFDKTRFDIDIAARDLTGPAFGSVNANLATAQANATAAGGAMGKFTAAAGAMKAALIALPLLAAAQSVMAFHKEIVKSVADIQDHADAIELTTEKYQALAFAGAKAGVSTETLEGVWTKFKDTLGKAIEGNAGAIEAFDKLGIKLLDVNGKIRDEEEIFQEVAKRLLEVDNAATRTALAKEILGRAGAKLNAILPDLANGLNGMAASARAAGVVVEKDVIEVWDKADDKAAAFSLRIRKLYADFAAPIYTGAVDFLAESMTRFGKIVENTARTWTSFTGLLGSPTTAAALSESIDKVQKRLDGGRFSTPTQRAELEAHLAKLRGELATMQAAVASPPPGAPGPPRPGAAFYGPSFTAGPGVSQVAIKPSGGADVDKAADALKRLAEELTSVKEAYAGLAAVRVDPTGDASRAIDLQVKIAAATSAALKGVDPNDTGRRKQISDAVAALETEKARLDDLKKALTEAGAIQRQFGDGSVELAERMRVLDEAFKTGRISASAYAAAVAAAERSQIAQAEAADRAAGGTRAFTGGFRSAARASRESADAFSIGAAVYVQGTDIMSQALASFATTGELSFARIANAFADMVLNMALKAASSGFFDIIGGLLGVGGGGGGIGGIISGLFGGGGGGGFAGAGVSGGTLFFADGGRPPTSKPSIVGENGPEMWWPDQAGTIYNRAQMDAMGSGAGAGGGSESPITINLNIETGRSQTIKSELMGMMPHIEARMHASIIDARRRGGAMRSAFA